MRSHGVERAPQDVREALLDAALKEFGTHGYAAASLDGILGAAGMNERLFHGHFNDKADLAIGVLERETARQYRRLGPPRPATTKDEFWAEMRARMITAPQRPRSPSADLARLAISAHRHPEVVARLGPYTKRWRDKLASLLRLGQEVRAVRSDLPMGVLITIAQGLKGAAIAAHLPTERVPSDGELTVFGQSYFSVLQRSLQARD